MRITAREARKMARQEEKKMSKTDADWSKEFKEAFAVPDAKANGAGLIIRCASEIDPEPVEWLWEGRLALGKHTCIAGEPGTGKSQLATAITAAITIGDEWPCGEGMAPQGSVIILSAEDGEADTILPRLHAAGADCGRVHIISAVRTADDGRRSFNLQADLQLLEQEIKRIGDVVMVCIDPISSYLGGADSHKNAAVRGVLEPIGEMADRMRVAVLSITHFSKSGAGITTKALHRFIGSIAFVGAPRMAFAVIEDAADKERRLMLHAKNNLAPPPPGLAFKLKQTIVVEAIVASRIDWEPEHVNMTADAALAAGAVSGDGHSAKEDAEDFLREVLADGAVGAKEVKRQAGEAGIANRTLMRAKRDLGVQSYREEAVDKHKWFWILPKDANPIIQECHVKKVGTLGTLGTLDPSDPSQGCQDFCAENGQGCQGCQYLARAPLRA